MLINSYLEHNYFLYKSIVLYLYIFYFFYLISYIYKFNIENKFNTCLVIRINNPTIQQLHRYSRWRKMFPDYFHFYILSMQSINSSFIISNIKVLVVTFNDIILSYPNIRKIKGSCATFKSPNLLLWISHTESLILFSMKLKIKYDYMWIIEQDVGFVGNLFLFITKYRYSNRDLITYGKKKIDNNWIWYKCATQKYILRRNIFFNSKFGYKNTEYIQRWSKKYIKFMKIDLDNNYHSQTESSTIEIVYYHNLTYDLIPKHFIGSPMYAGKSLSKNSWKMIMENKNNENKFFHPLKF